jgi:hypothetical protein
LVSKCVVSFLVLKKKTFAIVSKFFFGGGGGWRVRSMVELCSTKMKFGPKMSRNGLPRYTYWECSEIKTTARLCPFFFANASLVFFPFLGHPFIWSEEEMNIMLFSLWTLYKKDYFRRTIKKTNLDHVSCNSSKLDCN